MSRLAVFVGSAAFAWLLATSLLAQTYQVLHSFGSEASPSASVIADASGDLYGTTYGGGLYGNGTVFKLDAANNYALTTLHSFDGLDGAGPYAAVIADSAGNLYGTTERGGLHGYGTVFKLDAANNYALTTLHSFGGLDGRYPEAALIADASGNLYGTTFNGGHTDVGTVFKLDAANNYTLTTLHSFDGLDGNGPNAALIADPAGNLYGTTIAGGPADVGTVFKLDAANNYALTTLHSFAGLDGEYPYAAVLADAAGDLYGTTYGGGLYGYGTVFKLDAANNYALTTLHSFDGLDGYSPYAAVIADAAGNLYGTTTYGGTYNKGTVFKLNAANNYALTTLHSFGGLDGRYPNAALIADASGNLYGTTFNGGHTDVGTVFKLDAANNYALTTLHSFDGSDGRDLQAPVIADASGNLYGTTLEGGDSGAGTVFKLDAANNYALTTLHSFSGPDGAWPVAAVVSDASGNLYGTTWYGGLQNYGTVFKLDAANGYALTTLHSFSGPDGGGPFAALIGDAAGNLYGTTSGGGLYDSGTVFRLDAANNYALRILHSFVGADGSDPIAAVVFDASGNLYGTTHYGGSSDYGTVFKLDAANHYALTTLHSFGGPDGAFPRAAVIADASNNLFGTTSGFTPSGGGPETYGTVFKLDAANGYALTILHDFEAGSDGAYPFGALLADASGNLYGTTWGGQLDTGTVFRLDASNSYALTTLHSFAGDDGNNPAAGVIADGSGKLFGTTSSGGRFGFGVVFSLIPATPAAISGIEPTSGPSSGGTVVTITGTGFSAAVTLRIGGALATGVTVVSSTEITALTPPLPPGRLNDVAVTNTTNGPSVPSVLPGAYFSDFLDVPQEDIFHANVETVFRNGITAGCGGGNYCRNKPVTRAQMAVFLLKSKFGASHVPPACTGSVFTDVPCTGSTFDPWIEELAALGITAGCGADLFCPGNSVTRQQMAVFLLKTLEGSAYTPSACSPQFDDVPCPSQYADWISDLYGRGITGGCSVTPALYCPTDPSSRGQMAAFLTRTFELQ